MRNLFKPITLGKHTIPGNIMLAPLAGYTDVPFRFHCIKWGACFTFTEMISVEGMLRKNKKTLSYLQPAENEAIYGVQIFTSVPQKAAAAIKYITTYRPYVIDVNCGCPVPKVIKTGAGAALHLNPKTVREICYVLSQETDIPISVKFRSGWDRSHINYMEMAEHAIKGGASMLCIHPRTRSQGYGGKADHNCTLHLKSQVPVPVIASGDLFTPQAIHKTLRDTGCDGVVVARGALGNPFIFKQTIDLLKSNKKPQSIPPRTRLETALEHLHSSIQYINNEEAACRYMRKQLVQYTKGIPNASSLRKKAARLKSYQEYYNVIIEYMRNRN